MRAQSPALAELISADELLLLEDGHCIRDQALAVCHAIDPRRLRSFGATSFSTLLQLVAAGHGVTLLPQLAVDAGIVADDAARRCTLRRAGAEPDDRRRLAAKLAAGARLPGAGGTGEGSGAGRALNDDPAPHGLAACARIDARSLRRHRT